jgi:thiol-disulfide isomerase/thioredoxin
MRSRSTKRSRLIRILIAAGVVAVNLCMLQPAQALDLVMFSASWCLPCQRFKAEVLPYYYRTSLGRLVPITVFYGTDNIGFSLSGPVSSLPTFVLVENGHEVARFYGYNDFVAFFDQFGRAAGPYVAD